MINPRATAGTLLPFFGLALVAAAAWAAYEYPSRHALMMLALTVCTPVLDAIRQLRVARKGTRGSRKEWLGVVLVLVMGTAAIAAAVIWPMAAVSVGAGIGALVLFEAFRSGG